VRPDEIKEERKVFEGMVLEGFEKGSLPSHPPKTFKSFRKGGQGGKPFFKRVFPLEFYENIAAEEISLRFSWKNGLKSVTIDTLLID